MRPLPRSSTSALRLVGYRLGSPWARNQSQLTSRRCYPLHGPITTKVAYKIAGGSFPGVNPAPYGLSQTQSLSLTYPSSTTNPTDPLPAYFSNLGDTDGVNVGSGLITGPDATAFQIVPLSSAVLQRAPPTAGPSRHPPAVQWSGLEIRRLRPSAVSESGSNHSPQNTRSITTPRLMSRLRAQHRRVRPPSR